MTRVRLVIGGMTCDHCAASVRSALDRLDGVPSASVRVGEAMVLFDPTRRRMADLLEAVRAAGFTVVSFDALPLDDAAACPPQ